MNPDGSIPLCRSCGRSAGQDTAKYDDWLAKIRGNILFPQPEPITMRNELNHATKALHTLDEEIAALEATLEALELKRRPVETFVCQGKWALAPIRRLPPEVLLSIFSLVCERNDFAYSDDAGRNASTIRISQTCHYWRTLCLGSPQLWTVLSINPEYEYTLEEIADIAHDLDDVVRIRREYHDDSSLLDLYLERSGNCALRVEIKACAGNEQNSILEPDYVMAHGLLQTRSRSFETLTIDPYTLDQMWGLWSDGYFRYDLNEKVDRFPNLKQLTLRSGSDSRHPWTDDDALRLFSDSPITQVQFVNDSPRRYALPWKSIEFVGIRLGSIQDLQYLEKMDPGLSSLNIENLLFSNSNLDQLHFPGVISLEIKDDSEEIDYYLEILRCPGLKVLEVRGDGWVASNKLGMLFDSDTGSAPLLHRLTLGDFEADVSSIQKTLMPFKNIRSLHLDFLFSARGARKEKFTAEDVSLLFATALEDNDSGFLPQLSEMTVVAYKIVIDAQIVGFLESRRGPNISLRLDRISFSRGSSNPHRGFGSNNQPEVVCANSATLERLRVLRAGGLHICINSDWSPLSDLACLE